MSPTFSRSGSRRHATVTMSTDDTVASRGGCCLRLWGFLGGAVGNWSLWKRHPRTSCLFVGIFACLQFPACPGNFCLFCEPWRSHLAIVPPIADCQFWQVHRIFLVRRPLEAVGRASFVYTRNCEFPSVTCGCVWNFTAWSVEFYICVCPDGFANLTNCCVQILWPRNWLGQDLSKLVGSVEKKLPHWLAPIFKNCGCLHAWQIPWDLAQLFVCQPGHAELGWQNSNQEAKRRSPGLGMRGFECFPPCFFVPAFVLTVTDNRTITIYCVYIYIYTIYIYVYIYIGNLYWCNFICIYT